MQAAQQPGQDVAAQLQSMLAQAALVQQLQVHQSAHSQLMQLLQLNQLVQGSSPDPSGIDQAHGPQPVLVVGLTLELVLQYKYWQYYDFGHPISGTQCRSRQHYCSRVSMCVTKGAVSVAHLVATCLLVSQLSMRVLFFAQVTQWQLSSPSLPRARKLSRRSRPRAAASPAST